MIVLALILLVTGVSAQTSTSTSYSIRNPVITNGLTKGSSVTFGLGQSLGQRVIGTASSSNFQLWSGYQYFTIPASFTAHVQNTPGQSGNITIDWNTPTVSGSTPIVGYDIGIGTTPYAYTFEDVGNVTSFIKTGLTSGTSYVVTVRAKTTGDIGVVYSNAVSVTVAGTVPEPESQPQSQSTTSGSVSTTGSIVIEGTGPAYSTIVILSDGVVIATAQTNAQGVFSARIDRLIPGGYVFGVYAKDAENHYGPLTTFLTTISRAVVTTHTMSVPALILNTPVISLQPSTTPVVPVPSKRSDLNADGYVNVSDFSILQYLWHKSSSSMPKADSIQDGIIDIRDFSILLYDWTG
jgi:hypothetical protein